MKIIKSVRGTMENVPSIEVNVDMVYVRSNIKRIEEPDFSGWEYDEIQYNKDNYIEEIATENGNLKRQIDAQSQVADFQEELIAELAFKVYK